MALNPFHLYTDDSNANTDALLHQDTKGSNSSATISTNGVIKALLFRDSDSNGNTTVDGVQHPRHTCGATSITISSTTSTQIVSNNITNISYNSTVLELSTTPATALESTAVSPTPGCRLAKVSHLALTSPDPPLALRSDDCSLMTQALMTSRSTPTVDCSGASTHVIHAKVTPHSTSTSSTPTTLIP